MKLSNATLTAGLRLQVGPDGPVFAATAWTEPTYERNLKKTALIDRDGPQTPEYCFVILVTFSSYTYDLENGSIYFA